MTERDTGDRGKFVNDRLRRLAAGVLITVGLTGPVINEAEANSETPAPADPKLTDSIGSVGTESDGMPVLGSETPSPADPMKDIEKSVTPTYSGKIEEVTGYKELLLKNECLPENVNFCAELMYALKHSRGFPDKQRFKWPDRTMLSSYYSVDDVLKFGKTGLGFSKVIYFKDKDGNDTNVPALLCLNSSDYDGNNIDGNSPEYYDIDFSVIQQAINEYEVDSPGFLMTLNNNDVFIWLQSKASDQEDGGAKYGADMIYFDYGLEDKKNDEIEGIIKTIRIHLGLEQFGNRLIELGGQTDDLEYAQASAVLKQLFAYKCCSYMYKMTKDKFYSDRAKSYNKGYKKYLSQYKDLYNKDEKYILSLASELESKDWVYSYGSDSWDKINSVFS